MAAKRKAQAATTAQESSGSLALTLTYDAPTVAREQAWAEGELAGLTAAPIEIATQADYTEVDGFLTDVVRRKDALVAMRRRATDPLTEAKNVILDWFRPAVGALETVEATLKAAMAGFLEAQREAERQARAKALAAVKSGEGQALVSALTEASQAQAAPSAGRATVRLYWQIDRIATDLLPAEYLCPDLAKILDEAKRQGITGDEPPVIPGVIFKQVASVGAKR